MKVKITIIIFLTYILSVAEIGNATCFGRKCLQERNGREQLRITEYYNSYYNNPTHKKFAVSKATLAKIQSRFKARVIKIQRLSNGNTQLTLTTRTNKVILIELDQYEKIINILK